MDRSLFRHARVTSVMVGLIAMAAGASGCASTASPPKAEFVAQANVVCEQASTNWDDLVDKLPATPIIAREKYVVEKLAPALSAIINQLRGLGYPSGDDEYLESIYADAESVAAKMTDQPGTDLQPKLDAPFASPAARFTAYGLDKCAAL